MIGQTISHYKILEKLGGGGMGVVYKALDTRLDRTVALKFLPPDLTRDPESRERFIHEAKAASALQHPNVCTIHDIDETDDKQLFIVMDCYEGESLKQMIQQGPLPIDKALEIAAQVAQGLAKAHESGIIHRDIKPANIMISKDGIARIVDFGLAKLSGQTMLTKSGSVVGTAAHMSPEQARGEEIDARTDIWSLGVVVYQMLTGRLPFRGEFETATIYSILNVNPEPIAALRNGVPQELQSVTEKALQKERNKRFQDIEEMLSQLCALKKKIELGLEEKTVRKNDFSRVVSSLRQKRIPLFWAAGLIGVIALGLLVRGISSSTILSPTGDYSIAVVPFANLSGPENDYLAQGISEDLIVDFSRLPHALVARSKRTEYYRSTNAHDSSIASQLGVRFLLKGSLQVFVARLKVNASLIDVAQGKVVWHEEYDRRKEELFEIKEEVLTKIVNLFGLENDLQSRRAHKSVPEVYDLVLQGQYYRDKHNKDDNLLAIEYFSEAVRKDSTFAPALDNLAEAKMYLFEQGWNNSKRLLQDALMLSQKAYKLDSTYSATSCLIGQIRLAQGAQREGISWLQKALELDKDNSAALTQLAQIYLFTLNEPARGVVCLKRLQDLYPDDWLSALNLGVGYGQMKNYPEASKSFRRAAVLNPSHDWPWYSLAYTFERMTQYDSAVVYYRQALQRNPKSLPARDALTQVLLVTGNIAAADSQVISGISLMPGQHELIYALGVVYKMGGKERQSRKAFERGLQLVKKKIITDPQVGPHWAYVGLFQARLGNVLDALFAADRAAKIDSTESETLIKIARVFAVLGKKDQMLAWVRRARNMNPEFDIPYFRTIWDFEAFRSDADLMLIAGE